jgi:hypothetical protein
MAEYAWVFEDLTCPECGETIADVVWFAWGGMLSQNMHAGPVYALGDRLLWFSDAQGVVHADVRLPAASGINFGDPRLPHVDVYEVTGVPKRCVGCGLELQGSRVSIRNGVVSGVDVVPKGTYDEDVHAVEIDPRTGAALRTLGVNRPVGVMLWPE